jgi:hypothetical protein
MLELLGRLEYPSLSPPPLFLQPTRVTPNASVHIPPPLGLKQTTELVLSLGYKPTLLIRSTAGYEVPQSSEGKNPTANIINLMHYIFSNIFYVKRWTIYLLIKQYFLVAYKLIKIFCYNYFAYSLWRSL